MKKKKILGAYEHHGRKFYEDHKAMGWKSFVIFGPPILVEAVKRYVRDYKAEHGLYRRHSYNVKQKDV